MLQSCPTLCNPRDGSPPGSAAVPGILQARVLEWVAIAFSLNNTLEGINTRITEAEAGVNDLENKMVEITGAEQSKERRMKRNEDSLRDLWDNIKCTQKEKRERKDLRKYLKRLRAENLPNMGKEIVKQVQEAQSPRQDKPKEEHSKTHSNQSDKNERQR